MSDWVSYLPLILVLVAFWLLVLRPARRRQRDFMATQQALSPGVRVMLASGIYGELVDVGDETVELRVAPDVVVTAARQAVSRVIEPETSSREDEPEATD